MKLSLCIGVRKVADEQQLLPTREQLTESPTSAGPRTKNAVVVPTVLPTVQGYLAHNEMPIPLGPP